MAQVTVYPNGTADVTVPYGQYIAIACYGSDQCKIYYGTGPNNFPQTYYLQQTLASGEVTLGTFATVQDVRIEAGAGEVYYNVGASPTISEPTGTIESSIDPLSINGLDSTSGNGGTITMTSGTAVADDVSGDVTIGSAGGGASASTTDGGASGAVTVQSGDGGANAGGGATGAGGDGGAVSLASGDGGATDNTGTDAGGAGGDIGITAGAGGAASAGTGDGGAGGTVTITAGTGGTSSGGTAGADGVIVNRGTVFRSQGAPSAETAAATVTGAELLNGMITVDPSAAGNIAITLPTGANMDDAAPNAAVNDSFDFSLINISTTAGDTATLTAAAGFTIVGNAVVADINPTTDATSGLFRCRRTAADTWIAYRLA